MISSPSRSLAFRITVTLAGFAVIGGALAGCSRLTSSQPQVPAAATADPGATAIPTTPASSDTGDVSSIQADLNAADSANSNAGGDISAGEAAQATNDTN